MDCTRSIPILGSFDAKLKENKIREIVKHEEKNVARVFTSDRSEIRVEIHVPMINLSLQIVAIVYIEYRLHGCYNWCFFSLLSLTCITDTLHFGAASAENGIYW